MKLSQIEATDFKLQAYGPALIVDPSQPFRSTLAQAFRRAGLAAYEASCKHEAVTLAKAHRLATITCELYLPDKPQWDLLCTLKRECPNSGIVVVTGFALSAAVITRAIHEGASGVLSKPVTVDSILAVRSRRMDVHVSSRPLSFHRAMWEFLNQSVLEAGSISQAARRLGLHARSLRRMLQKTPPAW
jgi:two-component system, response regulator RegA